MAGDWIKMRTNLRGDPAVIFLSETLNLDVDTVVGKLHALWSWASEHTTDGNAVGVTKKWLDQHVRVEGFAEALRNAGWLIISKEGIRIPEFDTHMSHSAKKRALNAIRTQNSRANGNASVTPEALQKMHKTRTRSLSLSNSTSSLEEGGVGEETIEFAPRILMKQREYDGLLLNHWLGDEDTFKADIAAASLYCRHTGKAPADGEAYMIAWKMRKPQFTPKSRGAGAKQSTTELNQEIIREINEYDRTHNG